MLCEYSFTSHSKLELLSRSHVLSSSFFFNLAFLLGFLPVIYTWLRTRRQSPSLQLQLDSEDSDHLIPSKLSSSPQELRGWKILLLWIPAACDLTGTTVSHPAPLPYTRLRRFTRKTAHECRPALHSRIHISNESWRTSPLRWYS